MEVDDIVWIPELQIDPLFLEWILNEKLRVQNIYDDTTGQEVDDTTGQEEVQDTHVNADDGDSEEDSDNDGFESDCAAYGSDDVDSESDNDDDDDEVVVWSKINFCNFSFQ